MIAVLPSQAPKANSEIVFQPETIPDLADFSVTNQVLEFFNTTITPEMDPTSRIQAVEAMTGVERAAYHDMFATVEKVMDAVGAANVTTTDMNGDPLTAKTGLMAHLRPAKVPELTRRSVTIDVADSVAGAGGPQSTAITLQLFDSAKHSKVIGMRVVTDTVGEISEWFDDSMNRTTSEETDRRISIAQAQPATTYMADQERPAAEVAEELDTEQNYLVVKAGVYSLRADRALRDMIDQYGAGDPDPKTSFYEEHVKARNEFNRLRQVVTETSHHASHRGAEAAAYREEIPESTNPAMVARPIQSPEQALVSLYTRLITQFVPLASAVEAAAGSLFGNRTALEIQNLVEHIQTNPLGRRLQLGHAAVTLSREQEANSAVQLELPYDPLEVKAVTEPVKAQTFPEAVIDLGKGLVTDIAYHALAKAREKFSRPKSLK